MANGNVVILDGGSATELERLGETSINEDPLWSARLILSNPELIKQAHKNFIEAGSDLVVTATYQASVAGFCQELHITENEAVHLMAEGTKIARDAWQEVSESTRAGRKCWVAGSVGPYGAFLHDGSEYTGAYMDKMSREDLTEWHRPRVKALLDSKVDILAIETIPATEEADAVLDVLQDFPEAKAWVTFTCKDGCSTCHGDIFSDAIEAVAKRKGVEAVGVNCTDPQYISPLLKSIQHLNLQIPIIVKPNSGEDWERGKGFYNREKCVPVVSLVTEWRELGATWIGGCCRIFPSEIADIKKKLQT
ncbi:homocysteine S-methyltransferase YbgG-like [Ylistrum balloti]|uniref:homocysteine S-methyltransferase YbgG-like n=1 Tax=Ylistrum balloti TaxID=509963 RepID=UPI002905BD7E|nr:homocysteine S-methyltransferase YbgG-like [Ylistrum balloti]